jgi:DNA-binding response OmpR family regulator
MPLAELELNLLRYLVQHAGRAVSREEILSNVWQIDGRRTSTRAIDMHVARLRDKLRDDPTDPRIVLTVRGKGYMFAAQAPGRLSRGSEGRSALEHSEP